MEIDHTSAWNAWERGNAEYENGNGESLELLIDAADYLDRNPDSGIMEEEKSDIQAGQKGTHGTKGDVPFYGTKGDVPFLSTFD